MQDSTLAKSLIALDSVIGVSGNEEEVIAAFKAEMTSESGLYDTYEEDPIGDQLYVRKGKGDKRLLLAAHMDEVGFVISYIEDSGFARIMPVGFHDDRMIVNQDLVFLTSEGKHVDGITGSKPAHLALMEDHDKAIPINQLFVDFGTSSAEETRALGLEIGDYGSYSRKGFFMNGTDIYTGKSVDDRASLAVICEVARRLKGKELGCTVGFGGTVQEEVGMRGGGPLTRRFKPDLMLAVDVTLSGGTPGVEPCEANQEFGKGLSFVMYDWDQVITCGTNPRKKVTNYLKKIARENSIPHQFSTMMGGGTDSWPSAISETGTMAACIGFPSRYIHTAVSNVKLSDMEWAVRFLVKLIEDFPNAGL
ncbi:MAG: M20/M25/M40 family metallo-hydrolase [Spirochaetaceae bacterium]|jgi:endoglucanase|nr:M20/M25/M40 family metallo-hydrolase [Spirochaetaceae bacterium]